MDRYYYSYDIDPSNRRYSEEELRQIRERYLIKQEQQAHGGSRTSGQGRLDSAWKTVLSLLSKGHLGARRGG